MTSSSPRKRRTTARTRSRSEAAIRVLGAAISLGLALAPLPSRAVDLRDAARRATPPAPVPTTGSAALRAARALGADEATPSVVTVARLVQAPDDDTDGVRVKSILPRETPDDAGEARDPDPQGAPATPRAIDRLPPRRESSREETRRRDSDDAGTTGARPGARPRPGDRSASRREAARKDPCAESAKACEEARRFLRDDDIASVDLDIRVGGTPGNDYPCECLLGDETFQPRRFASTTMTWKAAGYCHKPLYFEDWELERYGHSRGMFLDPFIAGAHFFVTLPILPYKAGMQAPWECVYPLGYYRPGSCAPWTVPAVPYSARGFAVQAATVTGLVFLLP